MLSAIILKEVRESIYNYRFLFLLIIGIVLIPTGMRVNVVSYLNRANDYNQQVKSERETISSSQPWSIQSGSVPIKGFLKPAPLAVFARGLEGAIPQFYTFRPGGYEKGAVLPDERSFSSEFGILDFAFIVQLVFSLIALIFGADAVSGEKELGTLRSILSNSVPRDTILIGKVIGGFVTIWVPFLFAIVIGVMVLGLSYYPFQDGDMLVRIFLIFASSSIFLLIYFLVGIMISSSTSRTSTSLVTVIVVWTFLQLVIPKVGGMVADTVYPVENESTLSMQKSLVASSYENEKSRFLGEQYHRIFGTDTILNFDAMPQAGRIEWDSFREKVLQSYKEKETIVLRAMDNKYDKEKSIQERIAASLSFVSPSAAFGSLVADLSSTGFTDRKKSLEAVASYQQTLDQELFGLVERTTVTFPNGHSGVIISVTGVQDPKSLPIFFFQRAGLLEIMSNNIPSLISLALWLVIPFAIAYRRFVKYDVR